MRVFNNDHVTRIMVRVTFIFTIFSYHQWIRAQISPERISFRHLGTEQELSHDVIKSIHQDARGWMWFGTEDGLNRYDGRTFDIFRFDPDDDTSLSDNHIFAIAEDKAGTIWIATASGGLDRFCKFNNHFSYYQKIDEGAQAPNLNIRSIYANQNDSMNSLYLGTEGNGLVKCNIETMEFTRIPDSEGNSYIPVIIQVDPRSCWLITENGIRILDLENDIVLPASNVPEAIKTLDVRCLFLDSKDNMWLGTARSGLYRYDQRSRSLDQWRHNPGKTRSISGNTITSIVEDHRGFIWVGTAGSGLNRYDPETDRVSHHRHDAYNRVSLSNDNVTSLFVDASGMIWIGTFGGINHYSYIYSRFNYLPLPIISRDSGRTNTAWSILEDSQNRLWLGTNYGLYTNLHRQTNKSPWKSIDIKALKQPVLCLHEQNAGSMWVGTYDGLFLFHHKSGTLREYKTSKNRCGKRMDRTILCIRKDPINPQVIWVGTMGGLKCIHLRDGLIASYKNDPQSKYSLSDNYVSSLLMQSDGQLWIGTGNGGINVFYPGLKKFTHLTKEKNGLSNNRITSLIQSDNGQIWVGTYGGGLNLFQPTDSTFTYFSRKDGLPNNVIYGILEDDKNCLWMSSNHGITCYNPESGEMRSFDLSSGLQDNEFSQGAYYKSRTGQMYFGGVAGVNSFDPSTFLRNEYIAPVVVTDFMIKNQPISIGGDSPLQTHISQMKKVRVNQSDNVISFTFAVLDYQMPERNQFAYQLQGFESDWNYTGSRGFVTYTNLDPGHYVLSVKGANCDGVWNNHGLSLALEVVPPFWRTPWFAMLSIISVAAMILLVHQNRTRFLRKHASDLEQRVLERTGHLTALNEQLIHEMAEREKAQEALGETEEKYRNYFEQSAEGIHRISFEKPIPVDLPVEEQIDLFYKYGVLTECNEAMAKMYGWNSVGDITGKRIAEFHGGSENEINREAVRKFINSNYRIVDVETQEQDVNGKEKWFLNNTIGFIKDGKLEYEWGTQRDITDRKSIENELLSSLKEKEVLLKEVHHRVKNNMQIISSLLNLQAQEIDSEEAQFVFSECHNRIRSMALVHEKLYASKDFTHIALDSYIDQLSSNLRSYYKHNGSHVGLELALAPTSISLDKAIPCGLVVNELMTNALKHAFIQSTQEDPKITITLEKLEGSRIQIIIADNGCGLPSDINMDETQSLGLKISNILVKDQLSGTLEIKRDHGTRFMIEFDASDGPISG